MPRKDQGWITFQTSEEERQILEAVCQLSQRTKTEVLRELLRSLKGVESAVEVAAEAAPIAPEPTSVPRSRSDGTARPPNLPLPVPPKSLKVSSRNVLEGRVKALTKGSVHTEVTLEIVHRVELTSTITTTSAELLQLEPGKSAYAVIKSSDVVIAMD